MPGAAILKNGLTFKQEKFCQAFIKCGNQTEAYRLSYDVENMGGPTINNEAYLLMQHPEISKRIDHLTEIAQKRAEATIDRVVAEYCRLAFLDVRKAFTPDGDLIPIHELDDDTAAAIAGIEFEEVFEGHGPDRKQTGRIHKIKLSDKQSALDALSKHLGLFAPDKLRLEWDGDPSKLTDVQLETLMKILAASIEEEKRQAPKQIEATVIDTKAILRSWADITDPEERANLAREWKDKGPAMPADLSKEDRVAWLDNNWPLSSHETTS